MDSSKQKLLQELMRVNQRTAEYAFQEETQHTPESAARLRAQLAQHRALNEHLRRVLHEQVAARSPGADEVLENLIAIDPWWNEGRVDSEQPEA